jgi:hypothetical protein
VGKIVKDIVFTKYDVVEKFQQSKLKRKINGILLNPHRKGNAATSNKIVFGMKL